jgi:hypothetical protein
LLVYDVLGRAVRQIDCRRMQAGSHERVLDASSLASGAYYGRIEFVPERTRARKVSESVRLMLVK